MYIEPLSSGWLRSDDAYSRALVHLNLDHRTHYHDSRLHVSVIINLFFFDKNHILYSLILESHHVPGVATPSVLT